MKNKRKEEQAEQFKQMHVLMNPLRTNEENESALKSLLGMKGKGYLFLFTATHFTNVDEDSI